MTVELSPDSFLHQECKRRGVKGKKITNNTHEEEFIFVDLFL